MVGTIKFDFDKYNEYRSDCSKNNEVPLDFGSWQNKNEYAQFAFECGLHQDIPVNYERWLEIKENKSK